MKGCVLGGRASTTFCLLEIESEFALIDYLRILFPNAQWDPELGTPWLLLRLKVDKELRTMSENKSSKILKLHAADNDYGG